MLRVEKRVSVLGERRRPHDTEVPVDERPVRCDHDHGLWLRRVETRNECRNSSSITPDRCLSGLIGWSLLCVLGAIVWDLSFPINKNLWTSSYVLFSASPSLLTLALCYWLIDMRRLNDTPAGKVLLWPWLVFGSNAITAFVVSNLIVKIMLWIKVPDSLSTTGKPVTAWLWTYQHLFARNGSTNITSLAFAIAVVAACFVPNWLLWRKRIFLKV